MPRGGTEHCPGAARGLRLIPIDLAFMIIAPPLWSGLTAVDRTSTSYLLWNMLFFGGGALWAALVFPPLLRKWKVLPHRPEPSARVDTLVYTITITVLGTACTLGALIWWPGSNGAWLVLTVLAVTELGGVASVRRAVARVAGTLLGVRIAAILASVIGSEAVLLGIGLVLLVILVVIILGPHSYFLWTVFLTPVVILFAAPSVGDVSATEAQRLAFTLVGGALILLASGIALG